MSTPTHENQVKLGLTSLRATAERAEPRNLPQTGDSETDGMGQGGRQAGGQGPITPLWKGSLASSADRPGVVWKWEGASARGGLRLRKGHPQPQPFFPGPPAETRTAPGENAGRGRVGGRSQDTVTGSLRPRPQGGPQAPPRHGRGQSLVTGNSTERGQAEAGKTPRQGPPSPGSKPRRQSGPVAPPYRFSPGWYWGSVDVK